MKHRNFIWLISLFLLGSSICTPVFSSEKMEDKSKSAAEDEYFAVIGEQKVPIEEFQAAFRKGVRQKFYHGKVSKSEIDTFRKETADKLVNQTLLTQEARRRSVKIDKGPIEEKLKEIDNRNAEAEGWEQNREKVLAILRERISGEQLVEKLKTQVMGISDPTEKQLRSFYGQNKDKFTAPQQWGVSIIMLKVDPSSPSDVWAAAAEEAGDIVERIRKGANFGDLARIHSGDDSAENGGDMGYIHIGMLAKPAQQVLNLMEKGEISEPVMLLQGVAIFRLDGIKPARLNTFEKIKDRAKDLWLRENSEKAWLDLLANLKQKTKVQYGKSVFEDSDKKEKVDKKNSDKN